jgi:SAM-dependent methyltransferase
MVFPRRVVNWKVKAAIQRACASLPVGREGVYYSLQRTFGLLRDPDRPLMMQAAAALMLGELREQGFDLRGKRVMEIGTGWRIDMPIAFYLCGARSVVTYDLRRHLKPSLVMAAVARLARHRPTLVDTFRCFADPAEIGARLTALSRAADVREVFRLAGIDYRAPADATRTDLPARSIDLHMSFTVLQHIPYDPLVGMLREATRVLADGGVACHHIDLSDQFARGDPSISRGNFLRFSDAEWSAYGANQFAYHNRLRAPDYERAYRDAGHDVLSWATEIDERSRRELENGFPLAERFRGLSVEQLATDTIRAISRPAAR